LTKIIKLITIMKKLILFSLIVLSNLTYGQNFPGTNVDLIIGKELKVKAKDESLQKYGYNEFYKDSKLKIKFNNTELKGTSKYRSLVGKIFKLVSFESYTDVVGVDKFKLKIENPEVGILYYDYDPRFELEFEFEVIGGINYPAEFFCKDIIMTRDKFSGEFSYSSPSSTVEFFKLISGNTARTQIALKVFGSHLVLNTKGITILLENGFRIVKPDVKVEVSSVRTAKGYLYSAFFDLTQSDLDLLTANKITDYRLYTYDANVTNGNTLLEYIKCINDK